MQKIKLSYVLCKVCLGSPQNINNVNKMTMVFLFGHELITWLTEFSLFNVRTIGTIFLENSNYFLPTYILVFENPF